MSFIDDEKISLAAKGILATMKEKKQLYTSVKALSGKSTDSDESIENALNDLDDQGYIIYKEEYELLDMSVAFGDGDGNR